MAYKTKHGQTYHDFFVKENDAIFLNNACLEIMKEPVKEHHEMLVDALKMIPEVNTNPVSNDIAQIFEAEGCEVISVSVKRYYDMFGRSCPVLVNKEFDINSPCVLFSTNGRTLIDDDNVDVIDFEHLRLSNYRDKEDKGFPEVPVETENETFVAIATCTLKETNILVSNNQNEKGYTVIRVNKITREIECPENPDMFKDIKIKNQVF